MLKKSIASLVLSMVMLASGSVFAFRDAGVKIMQMVRTIQVFIKLILFQLIQEDGLKIIRLINQEIIGQKELYEMEINIFVLM